MTGTGSVERPDRDFDVVLVLSGGNALGAFQAEVYEALHTHGLQPDWVVGASIGAINGALIAGFPPKDRINALHSFWRPHVIGPMDLAHPWLSQDSKPTVGQRLRPGRRSPDERASSVPSCRR